MSWATASTGISRTPLAREIIRNRSGNDPRSGWARLRPCRGRRFPSFPSPCHIALPFVRTAHRPWVKGAPLPIGRASPLCRKTASVLVDRQAVVARVGVDRRGGIVCGSAGLVVRDIGGASCRERVGQYG